MTKPLICLLGGSFNPPHVGHFRIALEVAEALRPAKTLFIPTAVPPHKPSHNLLPFPLRVAMLRGCLARFDDMEVCTVEEEREGPSYTADTLEILGERYAGARLCFIMGGADYPALPLWSRWRSLPDLTDIAVLPRGGEGKENFLRLTQEYWPEATECAPPRPEAEAAFAVPSGGRVFFLPQPVLTVSSSLVRERFLQGRSIDWLVPDVVKVMLEAERENTDALWKRHGAA